MIGYRPLGPTYHEQPAQSKVPATAQKEPFTCPHHYYHLSRAKSPSSGTLVLQSLMWRHRMKAGIKLETDTKPAVPVQSWPTALAPAIEPRLRPACWHHLNMDACLPTQRRTVSNRPDSGSKQFLLFIECLATNALWDRCHPWKLPFEGSPAQGGC